MYEQLCFLGRKEGRQGNFFFFFFFEINNKTSLNETNQLQRAKAHRKCAEVNLKTKKTKMQEKYNYQVKQARK